MKKPDVIVELAKLGIKVDPDTHYNVLVKQLKQAKKENPEPAINPGSSTPPVEKPKTNPDATTAPTTESAAETIARLEKENATYKLKLSNKGIPNASDLIPNANKKLLRNIDRLQLGFIRAMENESCQDCSDQEIQAVEYEIRKYVKKGGIRMVNKKPIDIKGGYRKGLKPADLERAKGLLEWMGRDSKNPEWDNDIVCLGMEHM